MKKAVFILITIAIFSCSKTKDNSAAIALLQHNWMLVSHNGEVLRYVGTPEDYYNFSTDNYLYIQMNQMKDTFGYVLQRDGNTLELYHLVNGKKSNTADIYHIGVLTGNQLIIGSGPVIGVYIVDSLKR
jgi:hypothetical protein